MVNVPKITREIVFDLVDEDNFKTWNKQEWEFTRKFNYPHWDIINPYCEYFMSFLSHLESNSQLTDFYIYFRELKNKLC